jgi:hypothetical protein
LLDFGVLLAIVAILVFCGHLLRGLRRENGDEQIVGELLVQELVCDDPVLLPPLPIAPIPLERVRMPERADTSAKALTEA